MTTLTATEQVEARLWAALRDVEDPEIPISVVGMGLIVSIAYRPHERAVDLELTFTAMGCPAMDFENAISTIVPQTPSSELSSRSTSGKRP